MKKLISLVAIVAMSPIFAQTFNTEKMNRYMTVLEQNKKFMGTVAVAQNGKMLYSNAIGFADMEKGVKNTPETHFRIGSISKTFTAALIMKAVEENKLKTTDLLSKYFPEVKNSDKITLEQLLNHRSGIVSFTDKPDYLTWNQKPFTSQQMLAKIVADGSEFEPGTKMKYSNSNYLLLTYILEKVYQKPFAKLLEEKITKPLGLKETYVGGKISPAHNDAYSYKAGNNYVKDVETDMSIPAGAGAVVSTAGNLLKFADALFNGKLVSGASLEKMVKMTDGYGYGLFAFPYNGEIGYGHNGGIDSFSSMMFYYPKTKTAFSVLSNGNNFDMNLLAIAAVDALNGKDLEIPDFTTPPSETLKKLLGTYSSPGFPLKITISGRGDKLFAQATGQSEFPLETVSATKYKFDAAGIQMEFNVEKKEMAFQQMGREFVFKKED